MYSNLTVAARLANEHEIHRDPTLEAPLSSRPRGLVREPRMHGMSASLKRDGEPSRGFMKFVKPYPADPDAVEPLFPVDVNG